MQYLSKNEVVKLKLDLMQMDSSLDEVNDKQRNFFRDCNLRLAKINLNLTDFKNSTGDYQFSFNTAMKLIELEGYPLKYELSKLKKNKYGSVNQLITSKYFVILEELIKSHFSTNQQSQYLSRIKAVKTDVEIYNAKNQIIDEWFKEDDEFQYFEILNGKLAELFADIYSISKYPHLKDMDRISLINELSITLKATVEEHIHDIERVDAIRGSGNEDINNAPVDEIIMGI